MSPPAEGRRRGIQSVEAGIRVLLAVVSRPGPSALSNVANAAGMSASQAHRYLRSLIAAGMAKQDAVTGLYDLDAGAIRIGLAALSRLDIFRSADATFSAFARDTNRTCLLAVWGDMGPTIVRWFAGRPPVVTSLAIGSVMPLLNSATGQVFFAFGEESQTEAHISREAAHYNGQSSLAALRAQIRADCAAAVQGDLIPGLRAVAAPVFDLQGRLALVAAAIANGAVDPSGDMATRMALKAACRTLTEALGGSWPETVR